MACTLAVPPADLPAFFHSLFSKLLDLRSRTGRPHWIVADGAGHLPRAMPARSDLAPELHGLFLIAPDPADVNRAVLKQVSGIIAVGGRPGRSITGFADALGVPAPSIPAAAPADGAAMFWRRDLARDPSWIRPNPPRTRRRSADGSRRDRAGSRCHRGARRQ